MVHKTKTHMRTMRDKLFQDNTGTYVVAQPPNIPMYLVFVGAAGQYVSGGVVQELFSILTAGAIFTWAFLEIVYGESFFRRILGTVVMILFFVGRVTHVA